MSLTPGDILDFEQFRQYHRNIQVGIYDKGGLAHSIRFDTSKHGEYPDQWIKEGEVLGYIGQGKDGNQTIDSRWNKAMINSMKKGHSIKVFETIPKSSPRKYIYHGEWHVIDYKYEYAPSGRRLVKFIVSKYLRDELKVDEDTREKVSNLNNDFSIVGFDVAEPPERCEAKVNRIIRDTHKANKLKELYDWECQICSQTLPKGNGNLYAEVHHVQPLGGNHEGIDDYSNMLVLCPNHHTLFDLGIIGIDDNFEIISSYDLACKGEKVYFRADHQLAEDVIHYHNNIILQNFKE